MEERCKVVNKIKKKHITYTQIDNLKENTFYKRTKNLIPITFTEADMKKLFKPFELV
jgi:hypothetical protein